MYNIEQELFCIKKLSFQQKKLLNKIFLRLIKKKVALIGYISQKSSSNNICQLNCQNQLINFLEISSIIQTSHQFQKKSQTYRIYHPAMNLLHNQPKQGIYPFKPMPLKITKLPISLTYPESFFDFPKKLLLVMFFSSLCKLAMPFAMQELYKSMGASRNEFFTLFIMFVMIITFSYILERSAEKIMNQHKMQVKKVLIERVTRNLLLNKQNKQQEKKRSLWTKISSNVNIYVNNYYDSYINLVFESFKTLSIIIYLLYKLGLISFIGLTLCGLTVWITLLLTKSIQKATFDNISTRDKKVSILTQYFQRIVDYQMSWLDSFIADRITKLEHEYQANLKRGKMFDCVCVGLWQFTTIGISSTVLCCYYYYYGVDDEFFEPATIVYFFQMLTFPLNAISWHLAGIKNAKKAILELDQKERKPMIEEKFDKIENEVKEIDTLDEASESQMTLSKKSSQSCIPPNQITLPNAEKLKIETNKIYGISTTDANLMRKMALDLSAEKRFKVGYADENSWFLPSVVQTLLMTPKIKEKYFYKFKEAAQILHNLEAHEIPYQNNVSTYSGGEKMRISLCRSLLWGQIIFIDSNLKSLDKLTRIKVLNYLLSLVPGSSKEFPENKYTMFIKDPQLQLKNIVDEWLIYKNDKTWQRKKNIQRVSCTSQNSNLANPTSLKKMEFRDDIGTGKKQPVSAKLKGDKLIFEQMQAEEKIAKVKSAQKIFETLNQLGLRLVRSKKYQRQKHEEEGTPLPKSQQKQNHSKIEISLKTVIFYFKSSEHLLFFISFFCMKIIGNYFTYFVNVTKPTDAYQHTLTICYLASAHIISIIFRSYFFASANLKEAKRICLACNDITIYNHINFYGQNQKSEASQEGKESSMTERLVCLTNSDENTLCGEFPFHLNIFFNNLGTVIGAIIMVLIEVPHMIVFVFILYNMILKIDKEYRQYNQGLKAMDKDQEIAFMKVINYIQQGHDYIKVYGQQTKFYEEFQKELGKVLAISNRTLCLGLWVKINYRLIMVAFMVLAISVYWIINKGMSMLNSQVDIGIPNVRIITIEEAKNYAGLAVMIRQIMSLADYIFYFSLSLADTRGNAVSIQRIRRYAEDEQLLKNSKYRKEKSQVRLLKIKQSFSRFERINYGEGPVYPLIQFRRLKFSYTHTEVFSNLDLIIYPGDRMVLKGKSGSGKTTLFKLITGLYPETYFPSSNFYLLSFSSQHPLRLPQAANASIIQNIDPYNIRNHVPDSVRKIVSAELRPLLIKEQKGEKLSYEDDVLLNNIRAYLYGYNGVAIYDEPQKILNETRSTYLVVTHHREFPAKIQKVLQNGKLKAIEENQKEEENKNSTQERK